MSKLLVIMRGLPASGKTQAANQLVADYEAFGDKAVRVCNDDINMWLFGKPFMDGTYRQVKAARQALVCSHFENGADVVILDNTNISESSRDEARELAAKYGALIQVIDMTDVPLETCLERNSKRENPVPEHIIHRMALVLKEGE